MLNLFESVFGWIARKVVAFVLIAAVLAAGYWGIDQYQRYRSIKDELFALTRGRSEVAGEIEAFRKTAAERVDQLAAGPAPMLEQRIKVLDGEIQRIALAQADGIAILTSLPLGSGYVDHMKREVGLRLLRQEREHLLRLRSSLSLMRDGPAELAKRHQALLSTHARLVAAYNAQEQLRRDSPTLSKIFATPQYNALKQMEAAYDALYREYERAEADFRFRKRVVDAATAAKKSFEVDEGPLASALQPLDAAIQDREARRLGNLPVRVVDRLRPVLLPALGILLSLILLPITIKALFYFVLAPLVARRPPDSLMPGASGAIETRPGAVLSAVSQSLRVAPGQELLVHSEYLQSTPATARTDTKWLLNWTYPLSSLASGLAMLTRVRVEQPGTVTVSSTRDPLSEIGILELPEGSAVVFLPRNLVGVLHEREKPLRITRHWRLGSLHAWLTLQLRYLVFHGPVTLVAKGCRGIRVEKAETGRAISQAATLGFSANVLYSSKRSETFVAYARGHQPLFNDRFAGNDGFFVYEEIPSSARKSGLTGRGLEGVTDSVLKVFGL